MTEVLKVVREVSKFETVNPVGLTVEELDQFISRYSNIDVKALNHWLRDTKRLEAPETGDLVYVREMVVHILSAVVAEGGLILKEEVDQEYKDELGNLNYEQHL